MESRTDGRMESRTDGRMESLTDGRTSPYHNTSRVKTGVSKRQANAEPPSISLKHKWTLKWNKYQGEVQNMILQLTKFLFNKTLLLRILRD